MPRSHDADEPIAPFDPTPDGTLDLSPHTAAALPRWVCWHGGVARLIAPRGLEELPATPGRLSALRELDLRSTALEHLPNWVLRIPRLHLPVMLWAEHRWDLSPGQVVGIAVGERCPIADRLGDSWRFVEELSFVKTAPARAQAVLDLLADLAPHLRRLNVVHAAEHLPEAVGRLADLRALQCVGHSMRALPEWLLDLDQLQVLEVYGGQLEALPAELSRLGLLRWIDVSGNRLERLPDALGALERLAYLRCDHNRLTELPLSLTGLSGLQALSLWANPLRVFPEWVFDLPALRALSISTPPTAAPDEGPSGGWTLPRSVLDAPALDELLVRPVDYATPPPEVMRHGLPAIRDYWSQRAVEGTDYLCEAKLLIIGEAGAGKTSLSRKLRDPDAPLAAPEETTQGIDVAQWAVRARIPLGDAPRDSLERWLDINVWDFGGQEIYHSTHQFFLTRRSVYVLVANCRNEDTDFHYWLRAAELFGGDSPVLIVLNEQAGRRRDVDLPGLRARFHNLVGAWSVDLADNRGLDALTREIRQRVSALPHLGDVLPATWRSVRTTLDERRDIGAHYVSLDQYLAICAEHGFTDRAAKLHLSQYLHDIGACLHFQDDDLLRRTVIVDPEWGTDAVYKVFDHRPIIDARGRFTRADLAEVWADERYEGMHAELRALMERFQLIYPLPDGHAFIAPQLLHPSKPAHDWPEGSTQTLRYDYAFMPRGIVNRFIVATHDLIADQRLVWRSGVVLARGDARCEVVEDHPGRTVTVRVIGPDRRALLAIVDRELEKIHRSFPRLDYRTLVPCACRRCQRLDAPCLYDYEVLRRCARMGQKKQCDVSFEMVDPLALLDAAVPDRGDRGHFDRRPVGELADMLDALRSHDLRDFDPSQPPPREAPAGVYVSYAWASALSAGLVERLTAALEAHDIPLIRDRDALGYKASISGFMADLAAGRCVVVLLSPEYLRSLPCMRELIALAGHADWRARIFPVLLDPALLRARARLEAIKHWEDEIAALDEGMKAVEASDLHGIREEIDDCRRIRAALGRLTQLVGDLNLRPGAAFDDVDGLVGRIRAHIG